MVILIAYSWKDSFVSWIDWCWKNFCVQGGMWKLKNLGSERNRGIVSCY